MHRDLKLDNVLIHFPNFKPNEVLSKEERQNIDLSKEQFVVKIADLGYSRTIEGNERAITGCGTPLNMAPETIN